MQSQQSIGIGVPRSNCIVCIAKRRQVRCGRALGEYVLSAQCLHEYCTIVWNKTQGRGPSLNATYIYDNIMNLRLQRILLRCRIGGGGVDGTQPLVADQTPVVKVTYETRRT